MASSSARTTKKTTTTPSKPQQQAPSTIKRAYLVLFNCCSAVAWLIVLRRTLAIVTILGPDHVYPLVGKWTKWTQTLAALEVAHSLLGIVRSPIATTFLQVASRFVLVWGVLYLFPALGAQPFCASMLLAWSITEVIRYSYFALALCGAHPRALTWLRYNTFFVLYPIGILSECILIALATQPATAVHPLLPLVLYAVLLIYVPGSYVLYTYMMKQRKKVMRELKAKDEKSSQ